MTNRKISGEIFPKYQSLKHNTDMFNQKFQDYFLSRKSKRLTSSLLILIEKLLICNVVVQLFLAIAIMSLIRIYFSDVNCFRDGSNRWLHTLVALNLLTSFSFSTNNGVLFCYMSKWLVNYSLIISDIWLGFQARGEMKDDECELASQLLISFNVLSIFTLVMALLFLLKFTVLGYTSPNSVEYKEIVANYGTFSKIGKDVEHSGLIDSNFKSFTTGV